MRIKGFDKNLQCRGFQFEIGNTYDTGASDNELELCSDKVFHYGDSIQIVNDYYSCLEPNRYCEIEVLGKEITDGSKYGSNRIKILREIKEDELNVLKGIVNGNTGLFNTGDCNTGNRNTGNRNTGNCNTGDCNTGDCNTGNRNTGNRNTGNCNTGDWNTGDRNTGNCNTGDWNTGNRNTGNCNTGDWNTGDCNTGDWNTGNRNTGDWNTGNRNTGNWNTGDCNTGNYNTGLWNACDFSNGIFCNRKDDNIRIFNQPSGMSFEDFLKSKYFKALNSKPVILTEWHEYADEEKDTEEKRITGGYLKSYSYEEAHRNWWNKLTEENKKIIQSIPNFDPEIFFDITGIDVRKTM